MVTFIYMVTDLVIKAGTKPGQLIGIAIEMSVPLLEMVGLAILFFNHWRNSLIVHELI